MININTEKGTVNGCVRGDVMTLLSDTGVIIKHVYETIKRHDEDSADMYKTILQKMIEDGVLFDDDVLKKAVECLDKNDNLDDMLKLLRKFNNDLEEMIKERLAEDE